jgi:hypothetical protein
MDFRPTFVEPPRRNARQTFLDPAVSGRMGKPGNESKKTNRPTADFSIRRMQSSVWPPSVQGIKTALKKRHDS